MNEFTTPVGRIVIGDLYTPQDKDAEGRPLVFKNGPQAGQARLNWFVGLAIPKLGRWQDTDWGRLIEAKAKEGFPAGEYLHPTFAWKVLDGDSTIPNKKGKVPAKQEGFPGNWILCLTNGYKPTIYNSTGSEVLPQEGYVKRGYYIQANVSVASNGSKSQPGVFLNLRMVAFAGYGPEIHVGPDPAAAGFGVGVQLPPGASTAPVGALKAPTPVAPAAPAVVLPPGVAPNAAFMAPPTTPAKVMTAAATASYEGYISAGWTDAQLIQNGLMQP